MNDIKSQLLIDLITRAPSESIYECTDYFGIFDFYNIKSRNIKFIITEPMTYQMELTSSNKKALVNFFRDIPCSSIPTQENHIYFQGKKIFESYDNMEFIILIDDCFKINKEYYRKNGVNI